MRDEIRVMCEESSFANLKIFSQRNKTHIQNNYLKEKDIAV